MLHILHIWFILNVAYFALSWEHRDKDLVKVTGSSMHVKQFLDWFDELCKQIQSDIQFESSDFRYVYKYYNNAEKI